MPLAKAAVDFALEDWSRAIVAVILLVGTFVLLVVGKDVPTVLWALDSSAVTFFFAGGVVKSRE